MMHIGTEMKALSRIMSSLFNRSSKPELFVSQLAGTICVKDILDPQLPETDTSPEVFGSDTIISQECTIRLCLLASSNYL